MRHGKKINHLGRTHSHRAAMLSNMAASLILHKRIETTLAKAKELKKYVEPLLTRSKEDTTHNRRIVFSNIQQKEVIKELFSNVSDKIADRPGGYTRIIKLGTRQGDNAEMCVMELVDFNETMLATVAEKATKTRRSRRAGSGKKAGESATNAESSSFTDAVVVEETPAAVVASAAIEETVAVVEVSAVVEETEASIAVVEEDVETQQTPTADDLEIVEGIGPKIAEALATAGITTFAQLADMTPESIKEALANEPILAAKDSTTWPQQAALARDGKMDELKAWQDELNGGRETEG